MKKYLVLYHSNTGNSQFLAEKIAAELGGDSRKIDPIIKGPLLSILLALLKIGIAIGVSKKDIEPYDEVVIVGPIWAGQLIPQLKNAIRKCASAAKNIHFAVSCETSDEHKNDKYGYAHVLKEAENIGGKFMKTTEAFSSTLVNKTNKPWSPNPSEKIKITEENFEGLMKERFDHFISRIKSFQKTEKHSI